MLGRIMSNMRSNLRTWTGWNWIVRTVRHFQVSGKRGTFICARGLTNQCIIRGIIYDSPFDTELAYRIDYMPPDSDMWVDNAEIPIDSFKAKSS